MMSHKTSNYCQEVKNDPYMPTPRLNATFAEPEISAVLTTKAVIKFQKIADHVRVVT